MNSFAWASGPLTRQSMAFVLAGGRGRRLEELTDRRAKPAVYFGGKSRIIDFALSNAVNSGIRRIGVAGRFKVRGRPRAEGNRFIRSARSFSASIVDYFDRIM